MILDRVKGSLVGGAIGDALGYTVEFDSYSEILRRFGDKGITRLYTQQDYLRPEFQVDKGVVSDDTQMTFFTAYGLLYAGKKGLMPLDGIRDAYIDWYCTQSGAKFRSTDNWLAHIPALNVRRAPGMTCMTALEYIYHGQCASNNSKGCGGVMRVAPVGLWAATTGELDDEGVIQLAAQAARITHHHPLGYIPAGVAAHLVYKLVLDEHPVEGHVPLAVVLGDDDSGGDVASRVLGEVLDDGQFGQVELQLLLFELCVGDLLGRAGRGHGVHDVGDDGVLGDAHGLGDLGPGGEYVACRLTAVQVGEEEGGVLIVLHVSGGGVVVGIHGLADYLGPCGVDCH